MPLGAPLCVVTTTQRATLPLAALMVAQDTGGAIKGANRIDLFRGAGADRPRRCRRPGGGGAIIASCCPAAAAARLHGR